MQISATTKPRAEAIREREGVRPWHQGVVLHCVVEDRGTATSRRRRMCMMGDDGLQGPKQAAAAAAAAAM